MTEFHQVGEAFLLMLPPALIGFGFGVWVGWILRAWRRQAR